MTRRTITVSVTVPGLLARYTDDQRVVAVAVQAGAGADGEAEAEAATVGGTIDALLARYPELRPHLFTDGGAPREHLVFLADGTAVDPVEEADTELAATGGSVVIVQAVSGG